MRCCSTKSLNNAHEFMRAKTALNTIRKFSHFLATDRRRDIHHRVSSSRLSSGRLVSRQSRRKRKSKISSAPVSVSNKVTLETQQEINKRIDTSLVRETTTSHAKVAAAGRDSQTTHHGDADDKAYSESRQSNVAILVDKKLDHFIEDYLFFLQKHERLSRKRPEGYVATKSIQDIEMETRPLIDVPSHLILEPSTLTKEGRHLSVIVDSLQLRCLLEIAAEKAPANLATINTEREQEFLVDKWFMGQSDPESDKVTSNHQSESLARRVGKLILMTK